MQTVHKTLMLTIAFTLMFSSRVFALDNQPELPVMPEITEFDQWDPAEYIETIYAQATEREQVAEATRRNNQPEQMAEPEEKANSLQREFDEHVREIEQDRLRRAAEQLERLRNMTREAEEIVNNLRGDMARREMAVRRPEPEPIFRPAPEQPGPGPQMDILIDIGNQIRNLLAAHLERTEQIIHQNREQAEQRLQQLREENERLRMELRERNEVTRELENQFRRRLEERLQEQRERLEDREREIRLQLEEKLQQERQQQERRERQIRQRTEEQIQRQAEQREIQRQESRERREQLEQPR